MYWGSFDVHVMYTQFWYVDKFLITQENENECSYCWYTYSMLYGNVFLVPVCCSYHSVHWYRKVLSNHTKHITRLMYAMFGPQWLWKLGTERLVPMHNILLGNCNAYTFERWKQHILQPMSTHLISRGNFPSSTHNIRLIPLNTWRNNNVVITSKRRHFDVNVSKWRRFDVMTTSLLRNGYFCVWCVVQLRHRCDVYKFVSF